MSDKTTHRRFVEVQYMWQQPLSWIIWLICLPVIWLLWKQGSIYGGFTVVVTVIIVAILALVMLTRLDTEVSSEGVTFKMWPFHKSSRHYPWSEIESCGVRKYRPIPEYGGWGLRVGLNGTAYNIKGNQGMQLDLPNGKHILLGTQQPETLIEVLRELKV